MSTDPAMEKYFPVATSDLAEEDRPLVGSGSMPIQNLPAGGLYNSVNLQLYHYAANNPLKYNDPTGGIAWIPILAGFIWGMNMGGLGFGMYATFSNQNRDAEDQLNVQDFVVKGMAWGAGLGAMAPAGGAAYQGFLLMGMSVKSAEIGAVIVAVTTASVGKLVEFLMSDASDAEKRNATNLAREQLDADKRETASIMRENGASEKDINKVLAKMDQTFENGLQAAAGIPPETSEGINE